MDSKGRLIVLDRRDSDPRLSVWDPQTGKFIEEWEPLHLTMGSGFTMDDNDTFYVGDTNGHQLITVKDGKAQAFTLELCSFTTIAKRAAGRQWPAARY